MLRRTVSLVALALLVVAGAVGPGQPEGEAPTQFLVTPSPVH